MKLELTNPTVWKKLSEQGMTVKDKIDIYEKMGGAYRLGEDDGEQVFNKLTELLRYKQRTEGSKNHTIGLSQSLLDDIIKNANELKGKLGYIEKEIPAWIQDHISQSQNFINQANTNYHEL